MSVEFGHRLALPLANRIGQDPDQILVIDVLLAIGHGYKPVIGLLELFARQRVAKLLEAVAQRCAAGVLTEYEMGLRDANQGGSHDFVAERVGEHAVLMDARLVSESIRAHDGLVGRWLEGDDLAEHLACWVKLIELDAAGRAAVALRAHIKRRSDLLERRIACAFADAVDGALYLARAGADCSQ